MDFEPSAAIVSGLVGGAAMIVFLYMGIAMMPNQMRMNVLLMLGTMVLPAGAMAYGAGLMMHAGASIVFGLVHGAVFAAADLETATGGWGLLFGLVHWGVSGMALTMVGMMHPLMRRGEMEAPGPFAISLGRATAMGFLMLHLMFGLLVGALYGTLT